MRHLTGALSLLARTALAYAADQTVIETKAEGGETPYAH
jgi:hypothetical protein